MNFSVCHTDNDDTDYCIVTGLQSADEAKLECTNVDGDYRMVGDENLHEHAILEDYIENNKAQSFWLPIMKLTFSKLTAVGRELSMFVHWYFLFQNLSTKLAGSPASHYAALLT